MLDPLSSVWLNKSSRDVREFGVLLETTNIEFRAFGFFGWCPLASRPSSDKTIQYGQAVGVQKTRSQGSSET